MLLLLFGGDVAGSCLPRAFVGVGVGVNVDVEGVRPVGARAPVGPGVVEREYGWCRFPVMVFAPVLGALEALEFMRDGGGGCDGFA